jgi:LysR family transcriptional regulator, transcriptional activator of nhaA
MKLELYLKSEGFRHTYKEADPETNNARCTVEWLNYHHLLYFWMVAKEGSVARASAKLRLAHHTVSGQIHALERSLREKLFVRVGRRLELTEMGRAVFRYAEEIFALGRELMDTVKGRPTGRPVSLTVGVCNALPKLVAKKLIEPAIALPDRPRLVCHEEKTSELLTRLQHHELDVVLSDSPAPPGAAPRVFNHLLGECGTTFFASKELAARLRSGFPHSLTGKPMLVPCAGAAVRLVIDQWLDQKEIRPDIVAEFDDTALLKVF